MIYTKVFMKGNTTRIALCLDVWTPDAKWQETHGGRLSFRLFLCCARHARLIVHPVHPYLHNETKGFIFKTDRLKTFWWLFSQYEIRIFQILWKDVEEEKAARFLLVLFTISLFSPQPFLTRIVLFWYDQNDRRKRVIQNKWITIKREKKKCLDTLKRKCLRWSGPMSATCSKSGGSQRFLTHSSCKMDTGCLPIGIQGDD